MISTRTKLLQDQLLGKDIGAAARFLGYPELRALSIKGRANYVCARRLELALAEGREANLFPERRLAFAVLDACARTRPWGEVGTRARGAAAPLPGAPRRCCAAPSPRAPSTARASSAPPSAGARSGAVAPRSRAPTS